MGGIDFGAPPASGAPTGGSSRALGFGTGPLEAAREKKLADARRLQIKASIAAQGKVFSGSPDSYATNQGSVPSAGVQGGFGHSPVPGNPLYHAGDEFKPGSIPGNIVPLQDQLVQAGLLDPKKAHFGMWDDASATAYRKVLTLANQYGTSAMDVLTGLVQNPSADSMSGGKQASVIQLTNPTELRESFRQTFNNRTGHDPSPAAMDAFVEQYHHQEEAAGKALNDAAPGATTTAPPTQASAAQAQIDQQFKAEEMAYGTIQRQNEFFNMLGAIA